MVWYGLVLSTILQGGAAQTVSAPGPVIQTIASTPGVGLAAQAGDRVTVHLRVKAGGRLLIDSVRSGLPFSFVLGTTDQPQFLTEAVKGLRPRGHRECRVPAVLAGGDKGWPPILPPKTDLDVTVRLIRLDRPGVQSPE